MARIFEVNSLSEYINFVSKNNLNNFISRGENKNFDGIIASAFRYQTPIKFQNMILQFYNTIGNDVTNMQRENFVAFSQHHGIPTNLIDFSLSPLVSLFFACYNSDGGSDESGYVYFISKDRLINISDMMFCTSFQENIFQNLMRFEASTSLVIPQLYEYIHTHLQEIQQMIVEWANKLKLDKATKKKYKHLFPIISEFNKACKIDRDYALDDYSQKILGQIIKSNEDDGGNSSDFILWDEYIKSCHNLFEDLLKKSQYKYSDYLVLVLILIRTVLGELYDFSYTKELVRNINLPFYFTYYPPNILSRVENQSSVFIYQLYYDCDLIDPYIDETEHRIIQNISPDYTLKVNCKEEILDALDSVGINLKFIYSDYDNIAKYIKSKNLGL